MKILLILQQLITYIKQVRLKEIFLMTFLRNTQPHEGRPCIYFL